MTLSTGEVSEVRPDDVNNVDDAVLPPVFIEGDIYNSVFYTSNIYIEEVEVGSDPFLG